MKQIITSLFLTCALYSISFASQQQMRDMSLTVEETLREPDSATTIKPAKGNNAGTGFDDSVEIDPSLANQMRELRQKEREQQNTTANDLPNTKNSQSFMANFCSPSYTPAIRIDSATQTCQESQRQQACERFHRSTIDIQRLLDRAINCEYIAGSGEKTLTDCDGLDAGRLDLLKQYWQDEESSYTILFLPDMVLNGVTNCATTTIRKGDIKQ